MSGLIGTQSAAWQGKVRFAEADARPGHYYVTAKDERGRVAYLLGPFTQHSFGKEAHARALGQLQAAKHQISETYSSSAWWTFGTAWMPLYGSAPVGKLNTAMGR